MKMCSVFQCQSGVCIFSGNDQMTDPASAQRCSNSPAPHCISNVAALLTDVSSVQQIQPVVARGTLVAGVPCGVGRDEESGRAYSTKRGPFHEVFNLPENERPLAGRKKHLKLIL